MSGKMLSFLRASVFVFALMLGVAAMASAQATPPQGAAGPGQNTAAATAQAQNISTLWGGSAAVDANFNFGNPASVSTTNLPKQVQDSITVGKFEALTMARLALGIF